MANLKHKTRGSSSPQGKPKVYFCCHSEDFNKYFETVSDEILAKQNCAIWYTDEEIVRDEDFLADLKQMQLFVMPVTTNLLCTENEALDIEFKFAIENHIPVLPLMQEGGLEELFNKKCGDLQLLDKNNTDVTAISYDEKLQKYLESVLIGDELAEKVRAAFDAYVFLSYRKKDRKHAQELMRLIHKNEFCRDIAIWYDEFLTPGENFNDSIKEALQKSGLFVLAVTPNLVNETNYIMTTEYPMAKQEGKLILPAELVPTDREELSEKYEDIPNPADAHNEAELSEALLESIKKMAIKENDNSPEHSFFIGLAYLAGIDVEVNYERAVTLITIAAESGLIEAMKQLVTMYHSGVGVKKNILSAIEWQEKVVASLNLNDERNYAEVVFLGKLYQVAGQYKNAKTWYALLANWGANSAQGLYFVAVALYRAGNIEIETAVSASEKLIISRLDPGTYENAKMLYNESLVRFEKVAELGLDIIEDINTVYLQFAKLYCHLGDFQKARIFMSRIFYNQNWEKGLIEKTHYALPIDARFTFGDVYLGLNLPYETTCQYGLALELTEQGNSYLSEEDVLKYRGLYYQKLALFYIAFGNKEKAISNFELAATVRLELAQKTNLHTHWRDVSESFDKLSKTYEEQGNVQNAVEYAAKAHDAVLKSNNNDSPKALEHQASLVWRYVDFAENNMVSYPTLEMSDSQKKEISKYQTKINGLINSANRKKTESSWLEVVNQYKYLAQIYVDIEDYEMAAQIYLKAIKILEVCFENNPSFNVRGALARLYIRTSTMYKYLSKLQTSLDYLSKGGELQLKIQHEYEEGEKCFREAATQEDVDLALTKIISSAESGYVTAIEFLVYIFSSGRKVPKSIDKTIYWQHALLSRCAELYLWMKELKYILDYSNAARFLGACYEQAHDTSEAVCAYELSLDIRNSISSDNKTAEIKKDILQLHEKLAGLLLDIEDYSKAKPHFEMAVKMIEEVCNDISLFRHASLWFNLGEVYYHLSLSDCAEQSYEKSIELFQKARDLETDVFDKQRCDDHAANAYHNLGVLLHNNKRYAEAEKMYEAAIKRRTQAVQLDSLDYSKVVLAHSYACIGILYDDTDRFDMAEKMYVESIKLYYSLEKLRYFPLAKNYIRLGDLYIYLKRYEDAEKVFSCAKDICTNQMGGDMKTYEPLLAYIFDGLAFVCQKMCKESESKELKSKAIEIAKRYPNNSYCKCIKKD